MSYEVIMRLETVGHTSGVESCFKKLSNDWTNWVAQLKVIPVFNNFCIIKLVNEIIWNSEVAKIQSNNNFFGELTSRLLLDRLFPSLLASQTLQGVGYSKFVVPTCTLSTF